MHIRQATADDLGDLQALYAELQPDDPVLAAPIAEAAFAEILGHPGCRVFVGHHPQDEPDAAAAASTVLSIIPNLTRSARPYAVVENVIVAAALRGTGLGKAIMTHTLEAAWDAGCYKAMLMTGSNRPETHAFYRACGFDGEAKHAYLARPPAS